MIVIIKNKSKVLSKISNYPNLCLYPTKGILPINYNDSIDYNNRVYLFIKDTNKIYNNI